MISSSAWWLVTVTRKTAAIAAPNVAPTRRCAPRSVDYCKLGFMAIKVATGIQSALDRCSPKAMATEPATATARMIPNNTTGRLSLTGGSSAGISGSGEGCDDLPCTSHKRKVKAIQMADPMSQASACCHGWAETRAGRPAAADKVMRSQTLRVSWWAPAREAPPGRPACGAWPRLVRCGSPGRSRRSLDRHRSPQRKRLHRHDHHDASRVPSQDHPQRMNSCQQPTLSKPDRRRGGHR